MRRGLLLILALGLVVVIGAAVGGWQALRSETTPAGPTGWYGVRATAKPPPVIPGARPLTARVTITWNVATRQAKVYVGQSFTGIVGQGGELRAAQKMAQVMAAMRKTRQGQPCDLDADTMLPLQQLLPVLAALERVPFLDSEAGGPVLPTLLTTPGPGAAPLRPLFKRPKAVLELPEIEGAAPIATGNIAPLIVAYHPASGSWLAGVDPEELHAVEKAELQSWLAQRVTAAGTETPPAALLALPKDMPWRNVQKLIETARAAGITDLIFRAAPPQAPKPKPPNAK